MSDEKFSQSRLDALNSRGLAGKREYVRGLEQRSDTEALSLLVECLCDESWYLRELAEDSLMRIGERSAPVLLPLLEQGLWYTRSSAARVLGRFGRRDAIPGLLRLSDDVNDSVAEAAREALVRIGRHGGGASLARALHGLPPEQRRRRADELAERDRPLAERLDRFMRNEELMQASAGETLADDHPLVRAAEEGLEWEVLTGPARSGPRREEPGDGRSESGHP
ncbi:MAG TPA: HEAT repeat domain-containing protein [Dongiaceae bacterium]|nr:HEAT repeat domain-containing protein [Dongiaceae bacterium]